jgi:hypothetical protein
MTKSKGMLLLGAWLILDNALPLLGIRIPSSGIILTLVALAAGILLLVDK